MTLLYTDANLAWIKLLATLIREGQECAPRGKKIKEVLGYQSTVDMSRCIVAVPERQLGYKFMAAEAAWILSGDDRVATISPFARHISSFSDNGNTYFGAYGPKVLDQLPYVISALVNDLDTRQAVINIWRENPGPSKDIPCTLSAQFLIRGDKLHCIDTMRSSDAWLGWPYDVFNFSMLSYEICRRLKDQGVYVTPGTLYLTAGSQHLYEPQWKEARAIIMTDYERNKSPDVAKALALLPDDVALTKFLWASAERQGALASIKGLTE